MFSALFHSDFWLQIHALHSYWAVHKLNAFCSNFNRQHLIVISVIRQVLLLCALYNGNWFDWKKTVPCKNTKEGQRKRNNLMVYSALNKMEDCLSWRKFTETNFTVMISACKNKRWKVKKNPWMLIHLSIQSEL